MSALSSVIDIVMQQLDQPEYWAEYGLPVCVPLAAQLSDDDWAHFRDLGTATPPELQYRMANLAAYCDSAKAIPLLLNMMREAGDRVYVRIIESLGEFSPAEVLNYLSVSDAIVMRGKCEQLAGLDKISTINTIKYLGMI